jgi:hypothetical protein
VQEGTDVTKKKPGRPRGGSDTLADRGLVQILITAPEDVKRQMVVAAALEGKSLSLWLREVGEAAAVAAVERLKKGG